MFLTMKGIIIGLMLFMPTTLVFANEAKKVVLTYKAEDFTLESGVGGKYTISPSYSPVYKPDASLPALPYKCVYIVIGADQQYDGFELENIESLLAEQITISPNSPQVPTNKKVAIPKTSNVVYSQASYPDKKVEYTGTHSMGGYRILSFLICPFRYDALSQRLYLCKEMRLKIMVSHTSPKLAPSLKTSSHACEILSSLVENPEDLISLYPVQSSYDEKTNPTIASTPLKYLIITCDSMRSQFQRLADWKITKGVKTQVIAVEDIYNAYAQTSNHILKIKYAIRDYYNNFSNGNLQYVLLGGGENIVPIQNCYAICPEDNDTTAVAPCDLFYACLADINWDTNGNSLHGEIEDNINISPTVALTRLPVNTVAEASNMVDRIISYERFPKNVDNWKNEMLMCAAEEHMCLYNGDYVSWSHATSEEIYQTYIANSLWDGSRFRFYDTGTDHPLLGADYDVTCDNLCNELSKGYSFVNVHAHGDVQAYELEGNESFFSQNANTITNPRYSVVVTEACYTNDIRFPICMGSKFINNPNGGIMAYYGSADLAYGKIEDDMGSIDHFCGGFFNSLFVQSRNLGEAMRSSKVSRIGACSEYNVERWNYFFLNMLGDPEMQVYTSTPSWQDEVVVNHVSNNFVIQPGNERGYHCMMSRLDNGVSFYDAGLDSGSSISYNNLSGEYLLCLTNPNLNLVPYRSIIGSSVYLQNESLYDNLNVVADFTYIGSDVVSGRSTGCVVVENGHSVIDSRYGVTIENDFEVLPGASLEITTNQPQNY